MEQACQHIVMAAAAASSAHTPPLCCCHYRNTSFHYPKHCSSRWTSLQGPTKWNTIQTPATELHLKRTYFKFPHLLPQLQSPSHSIVCRGKGFLIRTAVCPLQTAQHAGNRSAHCQQEQACSLWSLNTLWWNIHKFAPALLTNLVFWHGFAVTDSYYELQCSWSREGFIQLVVKWHTERDRDVAGQPVHNPQHTSFIFVTGFYFFLLLYRWQH